MIKTITYNPRAKNITLETDSPTYPTYVCYTQASLCHALEKFDKFLSSKIAQENITLPEFIKTYGNYTAQTEESAYIDYLNEIWINEQNQLEN